MSLPSHRPTAARPLPVVLFDLDGTLIDSLELLVGAMQHAFETWSGPRPTVEEWVATIGRPLLWQFGQYATTTEEVQHLVGTYRTFQNEHHDRLTRPFAGIPSLVERLSTEGHLLGVVTSKGDHLANRSITHVGLAPFFPVVVGADRTTKHKPDPDPIRFALRELRAEPAQAVYVGDSPYDMMSANAAGVTSIGVTWGASALEPLRRGEPQHVVGTVEELDALLAKLRAGFTP
ncbi:MAG: HAD hydrolase-like protein [Gemmatimonadaceae bacterium]|nr:HAD hydrolase-like protein [Gemmatimonadaceae bacterium]